jgi:alpha-glucosidase
MHVSPWWRSAVVYQIYPRSFADTNGDGVGDLEGVRQRLDHLAWLGVDAIWLSPFYPSPMRDAGYDISDQCDVDPVLGTLDDFDRLLAEAHARYLRVVIGEVNIRSTKAIARYYGTGDELHMSFNFPPLDAPWDSVVFSSVIDEVEVHLPDATAWPTWVLSNHDNERHRTRYGGSERRARAAAVLLLTLRGTPFIYQGEELGLEDAVVTPETRVDPGGRDGPRAPIPWEPYAPHGWSGAAPWLPFPPDAGGRSVATLRADPGSILHLYRRLIRARRDSPALHSGSWTKIEAPPEMLAYRRSASDDERVVVVNFADREQFIGIDGNWLVEVASDGDTSQSVAGGVSTGGVFTGTVGPEQALILRAA